MLGQVLPQFHTPAFFPPLCYYVKYLITREINPTYLFSRILISTVAMLGVGINWKVD